MPAPNRTESVVPGQGRVGVVGDVDDGEIVVHKRPAQAEKTDQRKQEHPLAQGATESHPQGVAPTGTRQRDNGQQNREAKRQYQRVGTQLRQNHLLNSCPEGMGILPD